MYEVHNRFLTSGPECLGHTSGQRPVGGAEKLHDHAVAHALKTLHKELNILQWKNI